MMGVYIKDMKMPTSCANCQFSGFGGLRCERVVCMFTGANAYMNEVQYLDNCPLIPVPPHGRLIDVEALKPYRLNEHYKYRLVFDADEVANAPTIIPASFENLPKNARYSQDNPAEEGE